MSKGSLPAGIDVVCESGECRDLAIGSMCVETAPDPLWWKDRAGRKVGNNAEADAQPDSATQRTDPLPLPVAE